MSVKLQYAVDLIKMRLLPSSISLTVLLQSYEVLEDGEWIHVSGNFVMESCHKIPQSVYHCCNPLCRDNPPSFMHNDERHDR